MALMTVHGTNGPPSLEAVAEQLGLSIDDIDADFGVVLIDPVRGLYSVDVNADRLPPDIVSRSPYSGPFSNPRIGTFSVEPALPTTGDQDD